MSVTEAGDALSGTLKASERGLYWHYARLVENVGVRDFRMLQMAVPGRKVHKMEGR